jgi:hypothetical protein
LESASDQALRNQYTVMLEKLLPQRIEHLIAVTEYFPEIDNTVKVHIYKWDNIPHHFNEVWRVIVLEGKRLDGSEYGIYSLTCHGRGKAYGLKGKQCRYCAGIKFSYYPAPKGFKIIDRDFHHKIFDIFIGTMKESNSRILRI